MIIHLNASLFTPACLTVDVLYLISLCPSWDVLSGQMPLRTVMTLPLTDDGENFGPIEAPPGQTVHPRFMGMMPSYLPGYVACKVKYCNDRRIMIYLQFCIDKS